MQTISNTNFHGTPDPMGRSSSRTSNSISPLGDAASSAVHISPFRGIAASTAVLGSGTDGNLVLEVQNVGAYELLDPIQTCIYGKVFKAVKLVRIACNDGSNSEQQQQQQQQQQQPRWERAVPEQLFAVKTISRAKARQCALSEDPLEELAIMQHLAALGGAHANVLPLTEVGYDDTSLYAVLPYANGGELLGHMLRKGALGTKAARHLFRQVAEGLRHLHAAGVAHRDLSPENVLLHRMGGEAGTNEEEWTALIIDFGMAVLPAAGPLRDNRRWVGKARYVPPEVIAQGRGAAPGYAPPPLAVDMWPLGVLLWILLVGTPPWERADHQDPAFLYYERHGAAKLLRQWSIDVVPDTAVELLEGLLETDPFARLTIDEVLAHPFMRAEA